MENLRYDGDRKDYGLDADGMAMRTGMVTVAALFAITPKMHVIALDAATGREFPRRFAGRVKTGKHGHSDPAPGRA